MQSKTQVLKQKIRIFFLQPASLTPFVFLRVSFSIFSIILWFVLLPHIYQLYGSEGYMQWIISENLFRKEYIPTIQSVFEWTNSFYEIADGQIVTVLYFAYGCCFLLMLAGLFSNFFAAIAWFIHLVFLNTGNIYGYGVETFVHILLFYSIFMPLDGKWSLASVLFSNRYKRTKFLTRQHIRARIFIRLLQLHLCIIYLNAGLAKTFGSHWWNGEAVWRSFTQFQFNPFDLTFLYKVPFVLKFSGWMVMFVETFYPFFIWHSSSSRVFLGGIICMHLCIGVFMGLYFFAFIMILMNITAFAFNLRLAAQADNTRNFAFQPTNQSNEPS